MGTEHERVIAEFEADADRLKGLSLRDLGYVPHPRELSVEEQAELDLESLEWMTGLTEEERLLSYRRARLLAGAIWHASVLLMTSCSRTSSPCMARKPSRTTTSTKRRSSGIFPSNMPPRYNGLFARRFLIVAADLTRRLAEDWDYPNCAAQELAVRCLMGRIEITADTYDLDLDPNWRDTLSTRLLEDTDSDMLYDMQLDGFQHDEALNEQLRLAPMAFEHWFEPFDNNRPVTPYAS